MEEEEEDVVIGGAAGLLVLLLLLAAAAACFFMCALSIDFWVKVALHSWQACGRTPEWVSLTGRRDWVIINLLSNSLCGEPDAA